MGDSQNNDAVPAGGGLLRKKCRRGINVLGIGDLEVSSQKKNWKRGRSRIFRLLEGGRTICVKFRLGGGSYGDSASRSTLRDCCLEASDLGKKKSKLSLLRR